MSGHTPGPWRIAPEFSVLSVWSGDTEVASAWRESGWIDEATQRANARLIAAAPDLLAACEAMLAHEVYTYEGNLEARVTVPRDVIDQLRAAIAKARPE